MMPNVLRALRGEESWFPPARSAIVMVVDGLGRANVSLRAGHARFLIDSMAKKDSARSVFPSTTAAALTSLLTGTAVGEHGLAGYRVRVPGTDTAPNLLRGWETDGLDPLTFPRAEPIFASEAAHGRPCFTVSKPLYQGTGFTLATQRGAEFVGAGSIDQRVDAAIDLASRHTGALVYLYIPELDVIGHSRGSESDEWAAGLESVDRAARRLAEGLPRDVGAVLTADHGMVDVPAHRHILLEHGSELVEGVRLIAGEPRMLHLYAEDGEQDAVLDRWRASESERSWVLSRSEAVKAGLFGPTVRADVLPRLGDVMIAARSSVAYYDNRLVDRAPQKMVGQHGSLTDQERVVPLIRFGAFTRR